MNRIEFRERPDGFSAEADGRPPVTLTLRPTCFEAWRADGSCVGARLRFGLFHFARLLDFVAAGLLGAAPGESGGAEDHRRAAARVSRRLREQWLRLLPLADPTVLAVHQAIFAATLGDAPLALEPGLYTDDYLVSDILRYPAAAIAARHARLLVRDRALNRLYHSPHASALRALAAQSGMALHIHALPPEPDATAQLRGLREWMALYSPTGEAYRSLNRTLMNWPAGVPHRMACRLRAVRLERPLTHRLEVLAVTAYAAIRAAREEAGGDRADHSRLFGHATPGAVRAAMAKVSRHLGRPLCPGSAADVRTAVQFLADYPEEHRGTLGGLAEKAITWHRGRRAERAETMLRRYAPEVAVAEPPMPPPEEPGVRFLGTVGAIREEAERMRHCAAAYVDLAVRGNCFLFHVEHDGEEATVEVGREGKVRQAQGPRNARNGAASMGRRLLGRWASRFPAGPFESDDRSGGEAEEVPF